MCHCVTGWKIINNFDHRALAHAVFISIKLCHIISANGNGVASSYLRPQSEYYIAFRWEHPFYRLSFLLLVHGGYSPWKSWGVCSKSCDGGTQTRYRTCTNPRPAHAGQHCWRLGPASQTRRCNTYKCPGNSFVRQLKTGTTKLLNYKNVIYVPAQARLIVTILKRMVNHCHKCLRLRRYIQNREDSCCA